MKNLRYADDTVLMAGNEDLQKIFTMVETESKKMGLLIKHKKTKMKSAPTCTIQSVSNKIKQIDTFHYLGSHING